MVNGPNPYTFLGLMPGSSPAEIKRRYRELAKQYHPDCNGHAAGSEEKLRDLNAAYAFLSSPARKAEYDAASAVIFHPARVAQPVPSRLYLPRRRQHSKPARAAIGLTLLMLLSTGAGLLCSAANVSPTFSALFAQATGKSTEPDGPAPTYSFVPSHSAFDDQDTPQNASQNNSNALTPATLTQNTQP
jgi:curved DNA-binding protein CbpA